MVHQIVIENFSEYIEIAHKQRPKYYGINNTRIPKKYQKPNFTFKNKKLFNNETQEYVISNPGKVGKPRLYKVNGQDIYNSRLHAQSRATVMRALHEYFETYTKSLPIIKSYPIKLTLEFWVRDEGKQMVDLDNRWVWQKAFLDTLTNTGKIIDDGPKYVNSCSMKLFFLPEEVTNTPTLNIIIEDGS